MPKSSKQASSDAFDIPARIKALRLAIGMSAADLDRQTGLCPGTIGRLERGSQRVYASHLGRISMVTGVDVGWFYRGDDEVSKAPPANDSLDQEKQRLVDAYARIKDPALKHNAFELVKSLADGSGS